MTEAWDVITHKVCVKIFSLHSLLLNHIHFAMWRSMDYIDNPANVIHNAVLYLVRKQN